MLHLASHIRNYKSIKNIIFDFGGVICDLDIPKTEEKFKAFGPEKASSSAPGKNLSAGFEALIGLYETGNITSQEFRETIRGHYQIPPGDSAIDDAWNALLIGIPEKRIRLLENIRKNYRIFLLSNSNEIHHAKYLRDFQEQYGYRDFNELFEKAYFSFRLHIKKPGREVFELVLKNHGLKPEETLFIDDTLQHTERAVELGIIGYHLRDGEDITELFR